MSEERRLPLVPLLVALIGGFMAILDASIVNIAIPTIMNEFGISLDKAEWVITGYALALGVVVPLAGWLGDRMGYKQLYILSILVFTAGSALCGLSWNIYALIFFRVLQAVGGGMIMPVIMTMSYRMVHPERRGAAMGLFGVAAMVAPALGPTLGGYLVEYVNWRAIFYINVPIGIIGVMLAEEYLPDLPRPAAGPFDLKGFVTAGAGLFALLFALSEGQTYGWGSELIVFSFYLSAALLALFVHYELTAEHPMLDLRLFKYPTFTLSLVLSAFATLALFSAVFYVPVYLQTIAGVGAMQTGLILMPAALVTAVAMPVGGALYDRFGPKLLAFLGFAAMAWGTFLLHGMGTATPLILIVGWLVIRGIGMGLAMPIPMTAGMSVLPLDKVSRASSISNIVQRSAAAFGIAALTAMLQNQQAGFENDLAGRLNPGSPQAQGFLQALGGPAGVALTRLSQLVQQQSFTQAMDNLFILTALVAALGGVLAVFLKAPKGRRMPMGGD